MGVDLEKFAGIFVDAAFGLASKNLTTSEFDGQLRRKVSEGISKGEDGGISEEQVLQLHHLFYWTFFNNGYLQYVQGTKVGEGSRVVLRAEHTPANIDKCTATVLRDYGALLEEKAERLGLSTRVQAA